MTARKTALVIVAICVAAAALYLLRAPSKKISGTKGDMADRTGNDGAGRIPPAEERDTRIFSFLDRIFSSSGDPTEAQNELQGLMDDMKKIDDSPEELWIPAGHGKDDIKKQIATLRRMREWGNRMEKGTASPDEKRDYLRMKISLIKGKIEHIRATMDMMAEMQKKEGEESQAEDIADGNKMLDELNTRLEKAEKELSSIR